MIITVGTFDLFHLGHMRFLWKAFEHNYDSMVVGVNTDEACSQFGKNPVMDQSLRLATVKEFAHTMGHPDEIRVVLNPSRILRYFLPKYCKKDDAPHTLVIGNDWDPAAYVAQIGITRKELKEKFDCKLVFLPYTKGISSTDIKEAIKHDRRLTAHKK